MNANYLCKTFVCGLFVFFISGCGFISQQIREKNRANYALKNPSAVDPRLSESMDYAKFNYYLSSRFRVSHVWPKGMRPCKYSRIQLPKSQQDGTWYGSYSRLGDIFEHRDKTLQERKTNGFPSRSVDLRYLSIDEYVRSDKYVYQGKIKDAGLKPICAQTFIGSSHTLTIWLRKWDQEKWANKLKKSFPDGKFSNVKIGNNNWLVHESSLKPSKFRHVSGKFQSWLLPIGDTGYTYYFDLGASTESLNKPEQHEKMKKIFKHLVESVKIEPLSEVEATLARAKVKKLIQKIEAYNVRNRR